MAYARIVDGIVVEVIQWEPSVGHYPLSWQWVFCDDSVKTGFLYVSDPGVFVPYTISPTPPADPNAGLAESKAAKLDLLGSKRWHVQTGGIVVAGVPIATDDKTALYVIGARMKAVENPAYTVIWKVALGVHVPLDATTIIAIADAVEAHVQGCFTHEAELAGQITAAADHAALNAIEIDADWPG